MGICNHLFVEGFGGMGDAVVCCECGLDKYPEAISFSYHLALLMGRVIKESHGDYEKFAARAREARSARERRESGISPEQEAHT